MADEPLWVCSRCGWPCYLPEIVEFHVEGGCESVRRLLAVIARREALGVTDHRGVQVGSLRICEDPRGEGW